MPPGVYKRTAENTKNIGSWNKGLTKETDERVARGSEKMKGKHWKLSEEFKKKASESHKGLKYPNRKKPPPHSEETKEKIRKASTGRKYPKELYPDFGNRNKHHSEETKKKISISIKKVWQSPEFQETIAKALNIKPNNLERIFDKLTPRFVEYTGDYKLWIMTKEGARNPDFRIKGQNKIIELFGDYWHKDEKPQDKIKEYAEVGWKCIVFWENEIYRAKNESKYLKKILREIKFFSEEDKFNEITRLYKMGELFSRTLST